MSYSPLATEYFRRSAKKDGYDSGLYRAALEEWDMMPNKVEDDSQLKSEFCERWVREQSELQEVTERERAVVAFPDFQEQESISKSPGKRQREDDEDESSRSPKRCCSSPSILVGRYVRKRKR